MHGNCAGAARRDADTEAQMRDSARAITPYQVILCHTLEDLHSINIMTAFRRRMLCVMLAAIFIEHARQGIRGT
jgi:hypothetical protein